MILFTDTFPRASKIWEGEKASLHILIFTSFEQRINFFLLLSTCIANTHMAVYNPTVVLADRKLLARGEPTLGPAGL